MDRTGTVFDADHGGALAKCPPSLSLSIHHLSIPRSSLFHHCFFRQQSNIICFHGGAGSSLPKKRAFWGPCHSNLASYTLIDSIPIFPFFSPFIRTSSDSLCSCLCLSVALRLLCHRSLSLLSSPCVFAVLLLSYSSLFTVIFLQFLFHQPCVSTFDPLSRS